MTYIFLTLLAFYIYPSIRNILWHIFVGHLPGEKKEEIKIEQ